MQIIKQIHNKNRIRHDHAKEKQEVRKEKIKQIKDNPFSFQLKKLRQKFEHDILIAARPSGALAPPYLPCFRFLLPRDGGREKADVIAEIIHPDGQFSVLSERFVIPASELFNKCFCGSRSWCLGSWRF